MRSLPLLAYLASSTWGEYPRAEADLPSLVQDIFSRTAGPPRGERWPLVPGPDTHHRVCIVGGGPAGVHMAKLLKDRNFTRLVLLEKSDRVGGMSRDFLYQGRLHPLGTSLFQGSYSSSLIPLAEEYGLAEKIRFKERGIWRTNCANDTHSKLTGQQAIGKDLQDISGSPSAKANLYIFLQAAHRYIRVHQQMFGTIHGDLMQRPSDQVLHRTRGTFQDFLDRENLRPVGPIIKQIFEVPGYGRLDQTAALYGLIWVNPSQMRTLVLEVLGDKKEELGVLRQDKELHTINVLKEGYEALWSTIVEREEVEVRYNVDIVGVTRTGYGGVTIHMWDTSILHHEHCDFMVWTPPMTELLKVLHDPTISERIHFSRLQATVTTASVFTSKGQVRHSPYTVFMENVGKRRPDHQVTVCFDFEGIATEPDVSEYDQERGLLTAVCLQQGGSRTSGRVVEKKLKQHFEGGFNSSDIEVLHRETWDYFHRWSPEEVRQGRHWDVFKNQGSGDIWYAGSSVVFETVRSVLEYNQLLVRQMVPVTRYSWPWHSYSTWQYRGGYLGAI